MFSESEPPVPPLSVLPPVSLDPPVSPVPPLSVLPPVPPVSPVPPLSVLPPVPPLSVLPPAPPVPPVSPVSSEADDFSVTVTVTESLLPLFLEVTVILEVPAFIPVTTPSFTEATLEFSEDQ